MSNSQHGLMTAEQWNSYLLDWCWSILQEKKQVSSDVDIVTESLKTAFYEGTLLGKTVGFAKDLDLSKLSKLDIRGLA
jgi:hypothetical protein